MESQIVPLLPLKLTTIWNNTRPDGVTLKQQIKQGFPQKKNKLSKAGY
jgi:hypothetical protein